MKCGCTVILAEVVQDLRDAAVAGRFCENGFDIILMVAQQPGPQHHQLGVKESGAVSGVEHIFDIKILQCGTDLRVFSCMKDQEVSLCFLIEHMGKKFRKCAVSSKRLKESTLKSRCPHDNIKGKAVIKNSQLCRVLGGMMQISPVCRV